MAVKYVLVKRTKKKFDPDSRVIVEIERFDTDKALIEHLIELLNYAIFYDTWNFYELKDKEE